MDRLQRSVESGERAKDAGDFDSVSSSSLNTCSDVASDRSGEDVAEKPAHSPEEKAWMKDIYLCNEAVRLNAVLEGMQPSDIKRALVDRLRKGGTKDVVALGILFPRAAYPYESRRHCVRCHRPFSALCRPSCVLSHPSKLVQKLKQDPTGAEFLCHRCGRTFRIANASSYAEDAHSGLCDPCFKGKHTTDTSEIPSDSGFYQTCEETGCVEFYV